MLHLYSICKYSYFDFFIQLFWHVAVTHVRMEQPALMVLMAMLVYVRMDLKEPTVKKQVIKVLRFLDAVKIVLFLL